MLDVFSGDGARGAWLRERGARVTGIGAEAPLATVARSSHDEVLTLDPEGAGAETALGERRFELVVLGESLGRSSDPAAFTARYARYVEPEGRLLLAGESRPGVREALERAGLVPITPGGLVAARRPPAKGPLSLTVGMLTMDEEPSVAKMIAAIREHAPDAGILVVDSSRHDRTPEIATALGATVLRQLPPRGHGPAMELLMREASLRSDALIYLDCDFTYPPAVIPKIRAILEAGVDVVNAARVRERPAAMPLPNYVANKAFVACARAVHGVPVGDLHSGMRGYRSACIRSFAFDGEGDALPIDTLLWPARAGYRVVEIPIDYQERVGQSKLRKLAGTAWTFVRLARMLGVGERRADTYEVWSSDSRP